MSWWGLRSYRCSSLLGASDWSYKRRGVDTEARTYGSACHLGQPSMGSCEGDPGLPTGSCVGSLRSPEGSTVEAVWATLDQAEAVGLQAGPSYATCVPSSKHTEGTKPAMWRRREDDKKVCQVPTGSWCRGLP